MIFFATSVNANTTFFEDEDESFIINNQVGSQSLQSNQNYLSQEYFKPGWFIEMLSESPIPFLLLLGFLLLLFYIFIKKQLTL